jgi:GNAT superfamily N-acetyltransferase
MWWRRPRPAFDAGRGDGNRRAFRALVQRGAPLGLLAYAGEEPVGWCAIAPRADYPRLARSRVLAPVDDRPVWAVTCFFVSRPWRRRGLTRRLLEAAVRFARTRGARLVEGYPLDTASAAYPDTYAYTGFASTFRAAGFAEVARRSPTRPIVRRPVARRRRAG